MPTTATTTCRQRRVISSGAKSSVDSYAQLGLRAGLTGKTWEVWGELRNLTDKDYIALFSVKDQAAPTAAILSPGEPRSAYVGVKWQF